MRELARAKINLHLHMTGRADNGYHYLDSLVAFTNLCDDISIKPADDFCLTVKSSDNIGSTDDNLITRAAKALADYHQIPLNIHIELIKHIPIAAGLGGGSSDAATTLKMLKQLWGISTPDDDITAIAASMGSDIVACLAQKPVIMRDTGNILLPAPQFPALHGLLVNPNISCSTPQVYKNYKETSSAFSRPINFPAAFSSAEELCAFLNNHTSNDLTEAAIQTAPVIQQLLDDLSHLDQVLISRLSGSGATCFAIFSSDIHASNAADIMKKARPEWRTFKVIINEA